MLLGQNSNHDGLSRPQQGVDEIRTILDEKT
jgi:hypothetical protein